MGHIYFIMGISGAGKGTLISNLKKSSLSKSLFFPLSYKTRLIRPSEKNGRDAYFISREQFIKSVELGEFLEYAIVHETDYYGTKYEDVIEKGIHKGKIVVKEIDIHGLKKLKSEKPEFDSYYTTIFLNIPTSKLKDRIEKRGVFMSDDEYERRLKSALYEEEEIMKLCDYSIDATLNQEDVASEFIKIVKK